MTIRPTRLLALLLSLAAAPAAIAEPPRIDSSWVPQAPEVLSYRTTDPRGTGTFTVALSRRGGDLEALVNIVADGFSKTVWGTFGADLRPRRSEALIAIGGAMRIDTRTDFEGGTARIRTHLEPPGKDAAADLAAPGLVVDPALLPLVPRFLPLSRGAVFTLASIDPQRNAVVPYRVEVLGEEAVGGLGCYRVQVDSFEGRSLLLVERGGRRRVLRIEQPAEQRITELR